VGLWDEGFETRNGIKFVKLLNYMNKTRNKNEISRNFPFR